MFHRTTVLKLLNVSRALVAQAHRGRTFVKVDHALFDRFSVVLDTVTGQQPASTRETAELIVRDFMAANRTDDDAQATLTQWIADAIDLATLDLSETADNLRQAAQRVIDNWKSGDLAGAVRDLNDLLRCGEISDAQVTQRVPVPSKPLSVYDTGHVLAPYLPLGGHQRETACEYCAQRVPMSANAPMMHDTGDALAPCATGGCQHETSA